MLFVNDCHQQNVNKVHVWGSFLYILWSVILVFHYNDVIMSSMASQITSLTIVYPMVYSGVDQRNIKAPRHWPLCGEFTGDPQKGPVTRKMFPFDDVIMYWINTNMTPSQNAKIVRRLLTITAILAKFHTTQGQPAEWGTNSTIPRDILYETLGRGAPEPWRTEGG